MRRKIGYRDNSSTISQQYLKYYYENHLLVQSCMGSCLLSLTELQHQALLWALALCLYSANTFAPSYADIKYQGDQGLICHSCDEVNQTLFAGCDERYAKYL